MAISLFIDGVGVRAPGLDGWTAGREVLASRAPYVPAAVTLTSGARLPAAERRRVGTAVKLALDVLDDVLAQSGRDLAHLPVVFTSSGGDNDNVHAICEMLATDERDVSPTRFHNSVHNAAAGYWSIAAGSHAPLTSLCCNDASFGAGLLEAAVQAVAMDTAVVLAAYDHPYPPPLRAAHPIRHVFGAALLLSPRATSRSFAALNVAVASAHPPVTPLHDAGLEELRTGAPAARGLPLLALLARGEQGSIILDYLPGAGIELRVTPYSAS